MKKFLTMFAAVILCFTACENLDLTDHNENQEQTGNDNKPSGGEGEGETESVKFMTITVERVSATKVVFKGTTKKTAPDIEVGIYWSKVQGSHINDCEKVSTYKITNGSFELVLDDLDADTKYYCYPYLFMNGARELGDEFEFKTAQPRFTIDKVSVDGPTVTFTGYADYGCAVGIYCSTTSPSRYNYETHHRVDSDDNNYSLTLNLSTNTTYYYCSYVDEYSNDNPEYGTIKSFVTCHDDYTVGFKDLSLYSATDLSANGTANCYIVSRAGTYKMKTVKGNDANQALSSISKATILWETFGTDVEPARLDLIKGICYKSGYLIFETASTFREGNAVVAVNDASGKILWSWHIWFTDQPQVQVYYNGAGTMMDRNLGATSATPGDVGALGLLYQWGRKDPFLGSSSILSCTTAKSTISWPSPVSTNSSRGTVSYVVANPTTFVTAGSSSDYDWHYSSRDNTLWTTSDKTKSIYDPCPVGWRVPDGGSSGVWSKAVGSSSRFTHTYNGSNEGMNFSGKFGSASTIWYPASGYRYNYDGSLDGVGDGGRCWSASPSSNYAYCLSFYNDGDVYPSDNYYRALGQSVRCLQESK